MMPVFTGSGRMTLVLLSLCFTGGCAQSALQGHSSQEDLGMGIVSGTLGAHIRSAQSAAEPGFVSVVGQVQALEGGPIWCATSGDRSTVSPMMRIRRSIVRLMWAIAFNPGSTGMDVPC